jgi:chemosensory pili system protein ChpA (sensor histidine kinase/response regulator)
MSGFSIDDVRDSFTADIKSFLGQIEGASRTLLGSPALAEPADGAASFRSLGDCFHTVYGTSTLVGAKSLSDTAKRLERLAELADAALEKSAAERARARSIAALCVEGAAEMRVMLALELEHARADADAVALALAGRLVEPDAGPQPPPAAPDEAPEFVFADEPGTDAPITQLSSAPAAPAAANSGHEDEFSFADEPSDPPAPSAPASMRSELRAIFREEASEALGELTANLRKLADAPDDLAAVTQLERLYHTLKGAAATVGLDEVSALATSLQAQMEGVIENADALDRAALDDVLLRTNQLLTAADVGTLVLDASAEPDPESGLAQQFFLSEAEQICTRALELGRALDRAPPSGAREITEALTRSFHRLKGSALLSIDPAVAREAERLERLCRDPETRALAREIDAGARKIAALLHIPLATTSNGAAANEAPVREAVELAAEPALIEAFTQECTELLESLDKTILNLETSDQPKRAVESVFREYHTLKGAVNTIGLVPTGRELHLVEDFLEEILERPMLPSMKALATFLLSVQSDVRRQLAQAANGFVEVSLARVQAGIARVLTGNRGPSARPRELDGTSGSREARSAAHESFRSSAGDTGSGREAAAEGGDRKHIRVATERLDALMNLAGELVVSRSRLMSRVGVLSGLQRELGSSSRRLLDTVDRFREEHEFSRLGGKNDKSTNGAAALEPAPASALASDTMQTGTLWSAFSDLELDRYDDVNVLARGLAEITDDVNDMNTDLVRELRGFADDSDAFSAIVNGIQSEITRARMIPLESLFARLRLPVRDAAEREGKEVRVVNQGEEVSLDKTIADALFAPMLHLVRNAVVHGAEPPELRAERKKPRASVITLVAREESGQIVVEVRDDGGGLDLSGLHARGVALGLIRADTPLTDPAVKDLVFAPGLSTRSVAGAVSGRGIGGDVVRRAIERLNGNIRVESRPGQGTSFVMSLPISLAITKALLVRHGGRTFAVPLYFSERILDAEQIPVLDSAGVRRIRLDGVYMAARRMEELCGSNEAKANRGPVLVLRVGDQRVALQVDAVVGQEEIVVKSLGELLTGHPLFAGVTIRGTGELALILDVPAILESSGLEKRPSAPAEVSETAAEAWSNGVEAEPKPRAPLAVPVAPAITFKAPEKGLRKLRVLFVDDSLSVRKVAEKTLLALGAEVTLAVDGFEALARLREAEFDIVFTDLEMPRMHGYDLIRELRFLPAYGGLPIVVVSSRSGQKHQQQAHQLGASDYLTKPFSAQALQGALDRWCNADARGAGKSS